MAAKKKRKFMEPLSGWQVDLLRIPRKENVLSIIWIPDDSPLVHLGPDESMASAGVGVVMVDGSRHPKLQRNGYRAWTTTLRKPCGQLCSLRESETLITKICVALFRHHERLTCPESRS